MFSQNYNIGPGNSESKESQKNIFVSGFNPIYAEEGVPKNEMDFSDRTIRAGFIRKVFFMVTIMVSFI